MTLVPPTEHGLAVAAAAVRAGQVVAYPTETVYGLGVDPFNDEAVQRLFDVKGRPAGAAFIVIVSDSDRVDRVAADVSPAAAACIRAFWPGPLSILLPRASGLSDRVTAGGPLVCVRCPGSDVARALARLVGGALVSTSANRSGRPPALCAEDIELEGVSVIVDGGRLPDSPPSTVFDPDARVVVRPGAVGEDRLRAAGLL